MLKLFRKEKIDYAADDLVWQLKNSCEHSSLSRTAWSGGIEFEV